MTTEKHKSQRSENANTPTVRGAYPFCFKMREKRANGMALKSPRNDVTLLFPKLNPDPAQCANYKFLCDLVMQAATKAWGSWPAGGHLPIQDGDADVKPPALKPGQTPLDAAGLAAHAAKYTWRKGHWIIEATNYIPGALKVAVLQNGQVVEIPADTINGRRMFKSGDYCIASIHAYTFHNEKWGVNFGFEGILWVGEGEAIGSSGPRAASAMFAGAAPQLPAGVKPPGSTAPAFAPPAPAPVQAYAPPPATPMPPAAPVPPAPPAPPPSAPPMPFPPR